MTLVLTLLGWLLVLAMGVLLIVLVAPVAARAEGSVDEEDLQGRITLSWAWGLVGAYACSKEGLRWTLLGRAVGRLSSRRGDRKDKPRKEKKARTRASGRALWSHRAALLDVVARALKRLDARIEVAGTVGPADPADAGALLAFLSLARERLAPALTLDVAVDFTDPRLDLWGRARARLIPGRVVIVVITWMLSRDARRALAAVR
jgi:hypothetical protein